MGPPAPRSLVLSSLVFCVGGLHSILAHLQKARTIQYDQHMQMHPDGSKLHCPRSHTHTHGWMDGWTSIGNTHTHTHTDTDTHVWTKRSSARPTNGHSHRCVYRHHIKPSPVLSCVHRRETHTSSRERKDAHKTDEIIVLPTLSCVHCRHLQVHRRERNT